MKIISFYLPQFHQIPENDKWWGEGFTEWTNVRRGRSFYQSHYQPKIPLNNNYYDLSDDSVMVEQMALAKKYGLGGFCFYHYYFEGKLLLEKPVENVLNNPKADFPFCLAWANQSWSRTWYGKNQGNKYLQHQKYGSEKEWTDHFNYLLPFFKDQRYITVQNKPVFLIYLPQDFPKCKNMIDLWQKMAVENGLPGVYFIFMDTLYKPFRTMSGYDAIVEFEPLRTMRDFSPLLNLIRTFKKDIFEKVGVQKCALLNKLLADNSCSYDMAYNYIFKRKRAKETKTYLGAFPGWDNTARKDESGIFFPKSTPAKFEKYLTHQIQESKKMGNEFLFINAWNEWSEGAYLEPDQKYGYAYLKAMRQALIACEEYTNKK